MDRLNEYLKSMEFKKRAVGGLDEEDVLSRIRDIRDLAQDEIASRDRRISEVNAELASRDKRINEANAELASRNERISEIEAQFATSQERLRRCQNSYEALKKEKNLLDSRIQEIGDEPLRYQEARKQADLAKQEYSSKYSELTTAVKVLQDVKRDTEKKVRQEVREALQEEEQRARETMLAKVEQERDDAQRQIDQRKREASIEADRTRREAEAEADRIRREAEAEAEQIRHDSMIEVDRLRREIEVLRVQKQKLAESLRDRRDQLNRHLSWIDQQLGMEDESDSVTVTYDLESADYSTDLGADRRGKHVVHSDFLF